MQIIEIQYIIFIIIFCLAVLIILIFSRGQLIRYAWRKAAGEMGLLFINSLILNKIKINGVIDDFEITVYYKKDVVPLGSSKILKFKTYDITSFSVNHEHLPQHLNTYHPKDKRFIVEKGTLHFPSLHFHTFFEQIINLQKYKHITNSGTIINIVSFMLEWGKELLEDRA